MAQLEHQIMDFGQRLAMLEARADDVANWGTEKISEVRQRLDAMAKTVAAIEMHDARHSARLDALEAESSRTDARLDAIELALGALGLAAEQVAAKDDPR